MLLTVTTRIPLPLSQNHFRHQYTRFERFIDTRNIRAIRIRWDVSCLVGSVLRAKALPNFSYRALPVD